MPTRRVAVSLLAAVAALGASGCATSTGTNDASAEDFPAAQRPIVTAVQDLADNAQSRDYDAICSDDLTTQLRDRLTARPEEASCADQLQASLGEVASFDLAVQPGSVQVQGAQARVRVTADLGSRDQTSTLQLQRVGDDWRVSGI